MQPSISLEGPIFNVKNQNYYQNNWREQNCYDYPIKSQRFFRIKCIWLEMLHFECIQFFLWFSSFFGLLHGEQNENQFQYQQPASLQLMVAIEIRNILLWYPLDHVDIKFSLVPNMQKWEWVLNVWLLFCGFFFQREYQISSDEWFWISLFNSYTKSAHLQTILLFQTTSTLPFQSLYFYLPFQSFSKDAGLLHNINDEIELKIDRFFFNLSNFRENIVAMQEHLLIFSAFQFISRAICNFK